MVHIDCIQISKRVDFRFYFCRLFSTICPLSSVVCLLSSVIRNQQLRAVLNFYPPAGPGQPRARRAAFPGFPVNPADSRVERGRPTPGEVEPFRPQVSIAELPRLRCCGAPTPRRPDSRTGCKTVRRGLKGQCPLHLQSTGSLSAERFFLSIDPGQ